MKNWFSKIWSAWKKIGLAIGNFLATIFLFIFYFSIFVIFALPWRLFHKTKLADEKSRFLAGGREVTSLKDFESES